MKRNTSQANSVVLVVLLISKDITVWVWNSGFGFGCPSCQLFSNIYTINIYASWVLCCSLLVHATNKKIWMVQRYISGRCQSKAHLHTHAQGANWKYLTSSPQSDVHWRHLFEIESLVALPGNSFDEETSQMLHGVQRLQGVSFATSVACLLLCPLVAYSRQ